MNIRLAQRDLRTRFGNFTEILYYDGQAESIALVMGDVENEENILCRVHSACISGHIFNSIECECATEMASAQAMIEQAGRGVIIYLDQEGKGNGHLALIESIKFKKEFGQAEAYVKAGFSADARSYRPAAEILADLNVISIVLLTNNAEKAVELGRASIEIVAIKEMTF